IQRVGRVNRVDTKFDTIHTYNFFPTEESNDLIKLKEAAEAKIHAFIEMLGADARLLTEGEEIKSHDLFAKLISKKTITGEDEEEESELEYLTEIRSIRDEDAELFSRIKRLPKKARSTRQTDADEASLPSLVTYILKRLKAKEISRYHGYTEEDELFIRQVKQLLTDGALPRPTTKKVAEALKKEIDPLKVLGILRRDISTLFLQPTRAQESAYIFNPREVILSSYLVRST